MTHFVKDNMIAAQDSHPKRRRLQPFTDIHCHCLPGLDDGPKTMAEAIALCRMLFEEGIATVVATPHQLGYFDGCNEAVKVRDAVYGLNNTLRSEGIPLKVLPGGEVRVDERICRLLDADKILTLADGGRYVLLEFPPFVLIDIEPLLIELTSMGLQAIISHPERNQPLLMQPHMLSRWLEFSAHLQITASSLLGDFGPEAHKAAWNFLSSGWAMIVATDSHDINVITPRIKAAFRCISAKLGKDLARLVCIENPSRVINGQDIVTDSRHNQQEVGL